jgi:hypothetical protein
VVSTNVDGTVYVLRLEAVSESHLLDDQEDNSAFGPLAATAPFAADKALQFQTRWAEYLDVPVADENSLDMQMPLVPPGD